MKSQTTIKALAGAAILALALGVSGCEEEGPAEQAGKKVDQAAEDVSKATEKAAEDIKKTFGK